jgi:hypothetical protein
MGGTVVVRRRAAASSRGQGGIGGSSDSTLTAPLMASSRGPRAPRLAARAGLGRRPDRRARKVLRRPAPAGGVRDQTGQDVHKLFGARGGRLRASLDSHLARGAGSLAFIDRSGTKRSRNRSACVRLVPARTRDPPDLLRRRKRVSGCRGARRRGPPTVRAAGRRIRIRLLGVYGPRRASRAVDAKWFLLSFMERKLRRRVYESAEEVGATSLACISMPRKRALAPNDKQQSAQRVLRPKASAAGCFGRTRASA